MKTANKKVRFNQYDCNVHITRYQGNNRIAICLVESETEEPVTTASLNIPHAKIESDEVAIKNYSENTGILDVLIDAGILSKPNWYYNSGFVEIPVCKILTQI